MNWGFFLMFIILFLLSFLGAIKENQFHAKNQKRLDLQSGVKKGSDEVFYQSMYLEQD